MELFILHENASGYLMAHVKEWDQIAQDSPAVQQACDDPTRFGQIVGFRGFQPFRNAIEALENMEGIVAGESTALLRAFLDQNLPKKRKKCHLAVADISLGKDLASYGFPIIADKNNVNELVRACRVHHKRWAKEPCPKDLNKFQVGLGHSFSRGRIQFDPKRQDKPIQQAIALMDSLDKNINLFAMRLREWYCWHFPELGKIVTDHGKFAELVQVIGLRNTFTPDRKPELLVALDGNEDIASEILAAMKVTLGQDLVEMDMMNIRRFSDEVIKLTSQRRNLSYYLEQRLKAVSPNLQAVVGDVLSARLISHAGSLVNLAKYPASTVQILGAEKALFRALKTKGKTPKYGLLFHSSFIGRASAKNKGRISRYLANKCSLASRIDCFLSSTPTSVFGEQMRQQVEERLKFLTDRIAPRKNLDVMRAAVGEYETIRLIEEKQDKLTAKKEEFDGDELKLDKKHKKDKKVKSEKKEKKEKKLKAEEKVIANASKVTESSKIKKKKPKRPM